MGAGPGSLRELTEPLRGVLSHATDTMLATVATKYWDAAFAEPELGQLMHGLTDVPFGTTETPPEAREPFRAGQAASGLMLRALPSLPTANPQ